MSVALVTGAAGQDGSYLVERLLAEGHAVHGVVRREDLVGPFPEGLVLHELDLGAPAGDVRDLVTTVAPDEVYNLGGITSVAQSWEDPLGTVATSGTGALVLLEAALQAQEATGRRVRVLQAASAEIFGEPASSPQDETTPIRPVSPYGAAKALAHHGVHIARQRGLFACSVILYNHESPRRPPQFVTRKVTRTVAAIAAGRTDRLALGNLDARRDWGWAPDYVDAMVRALRHDTADDYVVATGEAHTVRDLVEAAFRHVGITDWQPHVDVDDALLRPADPSLLVGDASRARTRLGWAPTVSFDELVGRLVDAEEPAP
ncbi:GDP-mannose 4,6-dehydratase [Phycicoccus sp. CSK15P-2]|uniref:GDP-mannose 4,6-dehydratase n=1 Tax=Phycicoccus sp. CSK15P-2 TaxID=2807627 RepID=UPI00194FE781|nr:GDP-mannose 4,6-dehydratase [Phycicoccus sp. CSK15P-2]MBM6404319.1 GDP-mannose 4,6-dehydratase [Phycicoccus sp. CSK15P-2]